MSKKNKHSKKDDISENILDVATVALKKYRKVTKEISKLSTGQKIAAGIALAAAGLAYLAATEGSDGQPSEEPGAGKSAAREASKESSKAGDDAETETEPAASRRNRKGAKTK